MAHDRRPNGQARAPSQVQSVDRALAILDILARRGGAGVTEIAAELDVHKSTAFRLVMALEKRQLVEQVEERGKYRLGFGIVRLAGATTARLDLPRESRPVCKQLARELGETVNVAVIDSGQATNVTQEYGNAVVTTRNWVGQRTPLHATSSGKVLLAFADEATVTEALRRKLDRYTPRTITNKAALRAQLRQVRERGWAYTAEELEAGLNAVAAPIRDINGEVTAAVSVSGPSYRMSVDSFPEVAARLRLGADEISSRIGFYGSPR